MASSKAIQVHPAKPESRERSHWLVDGFVRCGAKVQSYRVPVETTYKRFKDGDHGKACSNCLDLLSRQ